MTNLDISIVFFCLMIILIMDMLAIGMREKWFAFISMIFAVFSLGYFVQNYAEVSIGTFIIPFDLFIIAWVTLGIASSLVIGLKVR